MSTNAQNLAVIRRRLNYPETETPSDTQLLEVMIDHLMNHHTELANTRNPWLVSSFPLNVSSGTEDHIVSAQDFGRPFLVYSNDPTDPYFVRREIPIRLMQDFDQAYHGPQQTLSTYPASAEQIAFYRQNNNWYARVSPIPGASGNYVVWYEVSTYTYASPQDQAGLTAFHNLIRVQTCLSALPMCRWAGDISPISTKEQNRAAWSLQADALGKSLLLDEQRFNAAFALYKQNSSREQVTDRLGFGWEYEDEWSGGRGGTMAGNSGWGF